MEIRCEYQQGVVTLTCGREAFARMRAALAAAGPEVAVPDGVDVLVLKRASPDPQPTPWLDGVGYPACAIVAAAVIALLGIGAYTVSSWLW